MKNWLIIGISCIYSITSFGQCITNLNNVDTLFLGVDVYFLVQENKTWVQADSCAASFGYQLAQIDSQAEQDSIFRFISNLGITNSNTVAPDGGGAAYVWLGGNDRITEGSWFWKTRNIDPQFWQGARTGMAIGGRYNHWGNEPDNFQNQDALGLALTNWPFGVAGEWNDVDEGNTLYYLMEFNTGLGIEEKSLSSSIQIYPNPAKDFINFSSENKLNATIQIYSLEGKLLKEITNSQQNQIDISALPSGSYWLLINGKDSAPFQVQ